MCVCVCVCVCVCGGVGGWVYVCVWLHACIYYDNDELFPDLDRYIKLNFMNRILP